MGIFDFVRNAGAKVGLGKSTDEIAAEEQAEAAADAAEKRAEYQKRAAEMATKRNAAKEKIKTRAAQQRSAENAKRREQARRMRLPNRIVNVYSRPALGLHSFEFLRQSEGVRVIPA